MIVVENKGPIVATAIHAGHNVRWDVEELFNISESERLREEDPFTDAWVRVGDVQVVIETSRFQVDLNRPPEKAVYMKPEDAWGLKVWKDSPPPEMVTTSMAEYDNFYERMKELFTGLKELYGKFLVLDFHSYCHRRGGPEAPPDDPRKNPEVNVGTVEKYRERDANIIDRFMELMKKYDFNGRQLDVRENVRFRCGHFVKWTHRNFPESACCMSIEFKKIFMDEWTGELYPEIREKLVKATESTIPALREELGKS